MSSVSERVYVAVGSNLGERETHILKAFEDVSHVLGVSALLKSSLYETEPMGPQDQPDYLNAVCGFDFSGSARQLLGELQGIERSHGRMAGGPRWGARPLDLDILLFGEKQINEPDLVVPHVGLALRSFVLWPLVELDALLEVPGLGNVRKLQQNCQQFGIRRYAQPAQ